MGRRWTRAGEGGDVITLAQGQEWTDGITTWRIVSKKGHRLIIAREKDGAVTSDTLTLQVDAFWHKIEVLGLRLLATAFVDDLPW